MKRWLIRAAAAGGSGALLFLACADFDIWPLAWFGFLPLLLAIRQVSPRRAFLWGWLSGLVANAGGFYWITTLLMRFGHLHWLVATALFTLLAAYQGLHWGAFAYLLRRMAPVIAPVLIRYTKAESSHLNYVPYGVAIAAGALACQVQPLVDMSF